MPYVQHPSFQRSLLDDTKAVEKRIVLTGDLGNRDRYLNTESAVACGMWFRTTILVLHTERNRQTDQKHMRDDANKTFPIQNQPLPRWEKAAFRLYVRYFLTRYRSNLHLI